MVMCLVGPKVMADRRPFELKPLLVVYNFGMVALSFFIWMEVWRREAGGEGEEGEAGGEREEGGRG